MSTQSTVLCTNCNSEAKRSTSIFAKGKEFPKIVEDGKASDNEDISLCFDCYSALKE